MSAQSDGWFQVRKVPTTATNSAKPSAWLYHPTTKRRRKLLVACVFLWADDRDRSADRAHNITGHGGVLVKPNIVMPMTAPVGNGDRIDHRRRAECWLHHASLSILLTMAHDISVYRRQSVEAEHTHVASRFGSTTHSAVRLSQSGGRTTRTLSLRRARETIT
jgi:hypothetical protein